MKDGSGILLHQRHDFRGARRQHDANKDDHRVGPVRPVAVGWNATQTAAAHARTVVTELLEALFLSDPFCYREGCLQEEYQSVP
jgi:hypothetical protein